MSVIYGRSEFLPLSHSIAVKTGKTVHRSYGKTVPCKGYRNYCSCVICEILHLKDVDRDEWTKRQSYEIT